MNQQQAQNKKPLSPFTIILAVLIIGVAITLPLSNRVSNESSEASEPVIAEEPTEIVVTEADDSILEVSEDVSCAHALEVDAHIIKLEEEIRVLRIELHATLALIESLHKDELYNTSRAIDRLIEYIETRDEQEE